ncbi:MAG: hypothetical protein IKK24_07335 [Clostridia bacterium]|nr:hypothetical protein [Clostridia bacterium]
MNKTFKSISLILIVVLLLSFIGCGDSESSAIVYFELDKKPDTLDAQLASDDRELMLVRNIYEGLLRYNDKGEIVCGAAESYEKKGLTYTFTIREDAAWSTGDPLTANDFVFAFQRAVSPQLKAPFIKRLFAIKNAEKIYNGKAKINTLGVSASGDRTLTITLEREDENFEKTLTTSICMPCNEAFFNECKGQYGLKSNYIISNGSYSLTKWNREDFGIRIYRNKSYNGNFKALNGAVFFSFEEDSTPTDRLLENKVDIAFIENENIHRFADDDFNTISYENICWVMTLSKDYSKLLRKSFAMLTAPAIYSNKLSAGFRAADSLFPDALGSLENCTGAGITKYNLSNGLKLFSSEISKLDNKKFPATTLTYYDNEAIKPVVTAIVGHWQQNLSAFVNITAYKNSIDLLPQLKKPTLSMCVFPIKISSNYLSEYLENYGINYKSGDLSKIQKSLLEDNTIIPIAFENTNIIYNEDLNYVFAEPENGYLDFSFIYKDS